MQYLKLAFQSNKKNTFQVYWLGPLSAGFVGALLYRILFTKDAPRTRDEVPEGTPLNSVKP